MLIGPPYQPHLPEAPRREQGLQAIYDYLQDFPLSVGRSLQAIVANTVALAGIRGISSSGVVPRNFVKQGLDISNATSATWIFSAIESDASYMILYSPTASVTMTGQTRTTTSVSFSFNPPVATGVKLDVLLLR